MDNGNKPFREESFGNKIIIVFGVMLVSVFAIGLILGTYFFGFLGIFELLGVKYETTFSLFLFVLFFFLLGIIGDFFGDALIILFSYRTKKEEVPFLFQIFVFFLVNWCIISFLNIVMKSIEILFVTQIFVSAILSIIEVTLDKEDNKEKISV